MMPATIVRAIKPRGPFTFAGIVGAILDAKDGGVVARRSPPSPRCIAYQDDGSLCGLPGRYIDMQRGGYVCFEHRPAKRKAVCV